ncbi:MAG: DUF4321 domain-containing protein [bacterium]
MKKKLSTLIFVVIIGMVIGSVLGEMIGTVLPDGAPKHFFIKAVSFGFGFNEDAILIDLYVIKIKLGIQFTFNVMSLVGLIISSRLFRWYR